MIVKRNREINAIWAILFLFFTKLTRICWCAHLQCPSRQLALVQPGSCCQTLFVSGHGDERVASALGCSGFTNDLKAALLLIKWFDTMMLSIGFDKSGYLGIVHYFSDALHPNMLGHWISLTPKVSSSFHYSQLLTIILKSYHSVCHWVTSKMLTFMLSTLPNGANSAHSTASSISAPSPCTRRE